MQARGEMQLDGLRQTLGKKVLGTRPVYPDRFFDQSEILRLGGQEIQLLYFHGGHTPGDGVVWLPKQNVLFAGDMIYVDRLLGVLPLSSATGWLASFEVMEKLKPKTIIPGHGQVCDLARARRDSGDYLRLLITQMQQAVDKGITLQEAIDSLDQSAFSHLINFDLLKGGNASRVYLEVEGQ